MFRNSSSSTPKGRTNGRFGKKSKLRGAVHHRRLRCEVLEDRRLLSIASGWGLPVYDLANTRFVPNASAANLGSQAFTEQSVVNGTTALTGDVNGDGSLELVVGDGSNVTIYNKSGSLLKTISGAGALNILADVNGDGKQDILASDRVGTTGRIRAFDNAGSVLKTYTKAFSSTDAGMWAMAVADLNQDGILELVAGVGSGYSGDKRGVSVFNVSSGAELGFNDTGGSVRSPALSSSGTPMSVSIGNVTGDGKLEIIRGVGSPANGRVGADGSNDSSSYVWCLNTTAGTIWRQGPYNSGGFYDSSTALADLNGDGHLQVIATATSHSGGPFGGTVGKIILLDPATGNTLSGYLRDFGAPVEVEGIADLNPGGNKEILVVRENRTLGHYFVDALNSTSGLTTWKSYDAGTGSTGICAINDINGDGSLEVIVAAGNKLVVLKNDLTELWHWSPTDGQAVTNAIVSDLNGDGINEIVAMHGSKASVLVGLDPNGDADGDGLLNGWETNGIDSNGDGTIDLTLNTNPLHKDLFVEVDAMTGLAPTAATLNRVVAAFAAAPNTLVNNPDGVDGVTLHVQLDETNIALKAWGSSPWADFDSSKQSRFGTPAERADANWAHIRDAKEMVYRYCIFSDRQGTSSTSGRAEIGGNDFMVTLGMWFRAYSPTGTVYGGTDDQQAGTFMHELGHTLGLRHGGDDDANYKPNYFSIMSYTWQVPSSNYGPWNLENLNYSREAEDDLEEWNLDEAKGIGGPTGYTVPVGPETDTWSADLAQSGGAYDWNDDGDTIDTGVWRNVNAFGDWADFPIWIPQRLNGHEDWSSLVYDFRTSGDYADGTHESVPDEEMTLEIHRLLESIPSDSNLPPVANDDLNLVTKFETPVVIDVLHNDVDSDGTIDATSVDIVNLPGNGDVVVNPDGTVRYTPAAGFTDTDTFAYQVKDDQGVRSNEARVTTVVRTLTVTSLQTNNSGCVVEFSDPVDAAVVNLYDVQSNVFGPSDVTLVGSTVGPVKGSVLVQGKKLTFIKTGGPLVADSYTLTLRSASDGVRDQQAGQPLDGEWPGSEPGFPSGDGTPGGDFVYTYTVAAPKPVVVSLPDFARGPGQRVNVPSYDPNHQPPLDEDLNQAALPIRLSNANGVTSVMLTLRYDPALLTITDVLSGLVPGTRTSDNQLLGSVVSDLDTPGQVGLLFYASEPLTGTNVTIARLSALVPQTADTRYGSAAVLDIDRISVNGSTAYATADDAVQVVALFGDVNMNMGYDDQDPSLILRVAAGLDSGFAATPPWPNPVIPGTTTPLTPTATYPLIDPLIIGDITGNGKISGMDANLVAQKALYEFEGKTTPVPFIPPLPPEQANHAPALDNNGDVILPTISEDDIDNPGILIQDFIASSVKPVEVPVHMITDPDSGALEGIAIVAADVSHGTWEYSLDNGANWSPLGAVSEASARLLASDVATRIRSNPASNFNGTVDPAITFRAWDRASGTNGGTGDATTHGGSTAFSDAAETASIVVLPVNDAPALAPIGSKNTDEQVLLSFTVTASDPNDAPPNGLTLSATGLPSGATFNAATGLFTWTPTETQGGASYPVTFLVADDGTPSLSDSETITIMVNEANVAPVLAAIGDKTVDEETALTFTATASDPDIPENTLTFSLVGAPSEATIDGGSGAFSWTPTEAQGPGSYTFTVKVTDNGSPVLSDEEEITVTVNEVNVAPVLAAIGDKTVDEETALTFTATASDPDIPANMLTFSLEGAPSEATIDGSSGAFSWTPTEAQGPGSYTFTVKVTDNGSPALSDEEEITVTVNEVNVAPTAADGTVETTKNAQYLLKASDFSFSDMDTGDALSAVQITTLATNGAVKWNDGTSWVFVVGNQEVTKADIDAGKLEFVPFANESGSPYAAFGFRVKDTGGPILSTSAYTMTVNVNATLLAGGVAPAGQADMAPLAQADLQPIVNEALAHWAAAGLPAQSVDAMAEAKFILADLPAAELGLAAGNTVYLDPNAAGFGWFVDPTPNKDEEFARIGTEDQLRATGPGAIDRMDLLSVVEHELGHLAGLEDLDWLASSLMSGSLHKGIRRVVTPREVDAVFASMFLD